MLTVQLWVWFSHTQTGWWHQNPCLFFLAMLIWALTAHLPLLPALNNKRNSEALRQWCPGLLCQMDLEQHQKEQKNRKNKVNRANYLFFWKNTLTPACMTLVLSCSIKTNKQKKPNKNLTFYWIALGTKSCSPQFWHVRKRNIASRSFQYLLSWLVGHFVKNGCERVQSKKLWLKDVKVFWEQTCNSSTSLGLCNCHPT